MSTQTKHTPGQWYQYGNEVRLRDKEGFNRLICQCSHHPEEKKEAQANANLIASAPELLEALEAANTYIARNVPVAYMQFGTDLIDKIKGV